MPFAEPKQSVQRKESCNFKCGIAPGSQKKLFAPEQRQTNILALLCKAFRPYICQLALKSRPCKCLYSSARLLYHLPPLLGSGQPDIACCVSSASRVRAAPMLQLPSSGLPWRSQWACYAFSVGQHFYDAMKAKSRQALDSHALAFPAGAASALHLVQAQVNP